MERYEMDRSGVAPVTDNYSRDRRLRVFAILGLIAVVAFLTHAPHTVFNVSDTNWDFDAHYGWALQFQQALWAGDPYPRWMPLGNHGLGEPTLLFYSPVFYYATALAWGLTSNVWEAMKMVEVASTALVGLFVFLLLRRFSSEATAIIGALLCQTLPMIFMLFHYFNGFPWGSSFAAFTALLYFVIAPSSMFRWFQWQVSVCVALLTATHVISSMIVLICMTFLFVAEIRREDGRWLFPWRRAGSWLLSVGVGLGLSMVYLYPALTSMDLTASSNWLDDYPPHDAFAFPTITALIFGMRWFTFQWVVPSVSLLAVLFSTYYALGPGSDLSQDRRRIIGGLLAVSWASLFLASELSFPLWILPTPLQMVQSPHRFLYVTALTGMLSLVVCVSDAFGRARPRWLLAAGTLPIFLSVLLYLALNIRITVAGEPLQLASDHLAPYGSYGEYQVVGQREAARAYTKSGGFAEECRRAHASCREKTASGTSRTWSIVTTKPTMLRLPVLTFPAWQMVVDGKPQKPSVDEGTGLIAVPLHSGSHLLQLRWERLPQEVAGAWLSVSSLALLLGLARFSKRRPRLSSSEPLGNMDAC